MSNRVALSGFTPGLLHRDGAEVARKIPAGAT